MAARKALDQYGKLYAICRKCRHSVTPEGDKSPDCMRIQPPHALSCEFLAQCIWLSPSRDDNRKHMAKRCPNWKLIKNIKEKQHGV